MKKKLNELIYAISRYTEIALSAIMLMVIIVLIIPMIYNFISIPLLSIKASQFNEFLGNILTLIIGVEFVKMLAKHTAENLLEVLMFAIARQMIVEHLDMIDTLIGIISFWQSLPVLSIMESKGFPCPNGASAWYFSAACCF